MCTTTIFLGHSRGVIALLAICINSQVEICFCTLRNTPGDLLKVPFKGSTCIYIYYHIVQLKKIGHYNINLW